MTSDAKTRPDFYCPKCAHGLLESQCPGDPRRCPRCKSIATDFSIANVGDDVPMFEPKLARRLEVKVGTPQVSTGAPPKALTKGRFVLPTEQTMFDIAKAIVCVEKVLNTIADRLENDGADPMLAVGTRPTDLFLLGEALEAVGRPEAARVAYEASADYQGDDPKER